MVHGLLIVLTDLLSWLTYCTVYHVLNCHCRQNPDDLIFLIWYDERRQKPGYRYGRVLVACCRTQIYLQVTENIFVCFVEACLDWPIVLTDLLSWLTYCTVYHVLNCHCRQNLDDPIFLIWYDERRQKKGYRYGRVLAAYCRTQIYLQVTENIFVCFVEAWTFQASPSKTELAKHWFCWR